MRELVEAIAKKNAAYGFSLNKPASPAAIEVFERSAGLVLPADFKMFYSICNGFDCTEDIFSMVSLHQVLEFEQSRGKNWYYFADYLISSDMWGVSIKADGNYEIYNSLGIVLTSSLTQFLERFLQGNVFDKGGLYDWHEEKSKS